MLHLVISNQSFDPPQVYISIKVDDALVVLGDFDVASQHNWHRFDVVLPKGKHELEAQGRPGPQLTEEIDVPDERWIVIDHWFYPGEDDAPHFILQSFDRPPAFG